MDMELQHHDEVDFGNPDFVKYAESFGAIGYRVKHAADFKTMLRQAVTAKTGVHIITVPVDYRENLKLIEKLGNTTIRL